MNRRLEVLGFLAGAVVLLAGCGRLPEVGSVAAVSADDQGRALGGYDVIMYYRGVARPGRSEFRYDYQGATFLFTSAANRESFAREPETFMPQYGGYCAYGMGSGDAVEPDPKAYTVVDGKLYLNSSPIVKRLWRWFGDVEAADAHWRRLQGNT